MTSGMYDMPVLSVQQSLLGSIVVSIPACHAGDRGSIPRRGDQIFFWSVSFLISSFKFKHACLSLLYYVQLVQVLEHFVLEATFYLSKSPYTFLLVILLELLALWPSGLRRLSRKQEIVGSNPTSALI